MGYWGGHRAETQHESQQRGEYDKPPAADVVTLIERPCKHCANHTPAPGLPTVACTGCVPPERKNWRACDPPKAILS